MSKDGEVLHVVNDRPRQCFVVLGFRGLSLADCTPDSSNSRLNVGVLGVILEEDWKRGRKRREGGAVVV